MGFLYMVTRSNVCTVTRDDVPFWIEGVPPRPGGHLGNPWSPACVFHSESCESDVGSSKQLPLFLRDLASVHQKVTTNNLRCEPAKYLFYFIGEQQATSIADLILLRCGSVWSVSCQQEAKGRYFGYRAPATYAQPPTTGGVFLSNRPGKWVP